HRPEDLLAGQEHLGSDVVEDGRADEAAIGPILDTEAAAVQRQTGTLASASLDGAENALPLLGIDDGAERGRFLQAVAGLQGAGSRHEGLDDGVLLTAVADRHQHATGQAALTSATEAGTDQSRNAARQVGIGQDDEIVLGTAKGLHTLAVLSRGPV